MERLAAQQSRRRLVRTGLLLVALGMGVMVTTTWPASPALLAIPGWGVAGVGMGLAYTTISLTVLSSWTKVFIHIMILALIGTPRSKPLLTATFSNKPR